MAPCFLFIFLLTMIFLVIHKSKTKLSTRKAAFLVFYLKTINAECPCCFLCFRFTSPWALYRMLYKPLSQLNPILTNALEQSFIVGGSLRVWGN